MFQAESGKVNDVAVALNHQCISYELGCVMFVLYEFGMVLVKTLALGYRRFANGRCFTVTLLLDPYVHYK